MLEGCDIMGLRGWGLKAINAIVFDMDGLLLDTESIALSTFVASCREFNFEPDLRVYYQCIGTTFPRVKEILVNGYGKDFPIEAIAALWLKKAYGEMIDKPVPLKMGALNLLRYLEKDGVKKAVVTSTAQDTALKMLANAQILPFFDFVLCGDQITYGKPHPEIYLRACQQLNEQPRNCLAIEDSDNGVRSAVSAGLEVIQVPDLLEPSAEVKTFGHRIVKSLIEVEEIIREIQNSKG
jgi:HAD superfamily hydrolase (TIGR01509 family)